MTTKATQQITELTFNEEMNPYIAKYLADKAVSNCDYLLNINRNNAQGFEAKMMKELDNNPESPDESKLAEWEQGLLRAEAQQEEWKTASKMIVKQIVAVYPDYQPKGTVTKSKSTLVAQAKARFAKK
jgi:hypothetical protein